MTSDLKRTLWAPIEQLRCAIDPAEYKQIVLGLLFFKYLSDAFDERRTTLQAAFADPAAELYLDNPADRAPAQAEQDYYTMANRFWVPEEAHWLALRAQAKQPDIGTRIDTALEAIEAQNPRLQGILDKRFGRAQLEPGRLGELVDLIATISYGRLAEAYAYLLGQFAHAEGRKGGQFYTPDSVVKLLVAVLTPHEGKVYDPCCGSGGMFVQLAQRLRGRGGGSGDISIYGQEANPATWRLAAMHLAMQGLDFNLGPEPADSFQRDQHPDLRADYSFANPPFNLADWGGERLAADARWVYGMPPAINANFAWLQHVLHHLAPGGQAGVVLANGSLSSTLSNEGVIRQAIVADDLVEVMVALPAQLFFNSQITACVWFLAKDKAQHGRDRRGEGALCGCTGLLPRSPP